jgi:hypothetical protein
MKGIIYSLLPLAASAGVLQPRIPQTTPINPKSPLGPLADILKGLNGSAAASAVAKVLPKTGLAKVTTLKAQIRPGAKRTVSSYGPYVLTGRNVGFLRSSHVNFTDEILGPETEGLDELTRSPWSSILGPNHRGSMQRLHHPGRKDETHVRGRHGSDAIHGCLHPPCHQL